MSKSFYETASSPVFVHTKLKASIRVTQKYFSTLCNLPASGSLGISLLAHQPRNSFAWAAKIQSTKGQHVRRRVGDRAVRANAATIGEIPTGKTQ